MFHVMFSIDCNPVGKGRPRFRRQGNFVKVYSEKKTVDFEQLIRQRAKEAMGSSQPLETPVAVFCYIRMPVTSSWSKKRILSCLEGSEGHCKRPDLDNLVKVAADGMNGVVYKDDCQIVILHATKKYDSVPGIDIMVKEELP